MGYGDDTEAIEIISRNIMQVALIQKERNAENEKKKKEFLKQISKLFSTLVDNISNHLNQLYSSTFLDPIAITSSIELIADSSRYHRSRMSTIRRILIWRLNSYTKNRQVIIDLTIKYVECFWDCYAEHYAIVLEDERNLKYAFMGMQSQASTKYADYIQNKIAPEHYKKQRELEKMEKKQWKEEKKDIM